MKKIVTAFLTMCILCGLAVPAAAKSKAPALRYGSDGKFRILCFADAHQTRHDQPKMIAFMGEAIDYAKPDLVVFLGDNVYGDACETTETELAAITKLLAPVVERGISFAFVWGNHDPEYNDGTGDSRPALMEMYQSFPGCLGRADDPATPGASSYYLPVFSSKDGAKMGLNLWFFDTGRGTVEQSQLDWYKAASKRLQAENGGVYDLVIADDYIVVYHENGP